MNALRISFPRILLCLKYNSLSGEKKQYNFRERSFFLRETEFFLEKTKKHLTKILSSALYDYFLLKK